MSQIKLQMVGLIQEHRGDDKEDAGNQIDKRRGVLMTLSVEFIIWSG